MNRRQARTRAYELAALVLPSALYTAGISQSLDARENAKIEDALWELALNLERRARRMRAMDQQKEKRGE